LIHGDILELVPRQASVGGASGAEEGELPSGVCDGQGVACDGQGVACDGQDVDGQGVDGQFAFGSQLFVAPLPP
jgi:hypothetical protein